MMERDVDEFYYITVMNENYAQPSLPTGVEDHIIRGIKLPCRDRCAVAAWRAVASGTILREVIAASELLVADWQVSSEVWSVTSFSELAREARDVERHNRLNPAEPEQVSHLCLPRRHRAGDCCHRLRSCLAATDRQLRRCAFGSPGHRRLWPQVIPAPPYAVSLKDRHQVVLAALDGLVRDTLPRQVLADAIGRYGLDGS